MIFKKKEIKEKNLDLEKAVKMIKELKEENDNLKDKVEENESQILVL